MLVKFSVFSQQQNINLLPRFYLCACAKRLLVKPDRQKT